MTYLPHLLAILVDASLTIQVGMNATVRGVLGSALIVDHYGAIGFPENPVTLWRVIGVVLLVAGVVLIMRR